MKPFKTLLIAVLLGAVFTNCSAQSHSNTSIQANRQTNLHAQNKKIMTLKIKAMASGYVKSGNYGGSTQYEAFPSVYNYSHFDAMAPGNEAKKETFEELITAYIDAIKVNNSVSLRAYLNYLYMNDTVKLQEIHSNYNIRKEVGNVNQPLPILFFIDDEVNTVLSLSPYNTELTWNETTTKLNAFLQENAKQFSSTIPDEFYHTYFKSK